MASKGKTRLCGHTSVEPQKAEVMQQLAYVDDWGGQFAHCNSQYKSPDLTKTEHNIKPTKLQIKPRCETKVIPKIQELVT